MISGEVIRATDPDANTIEWTLDYAGLTDAEQAVLQAFFVAAEGRLRSFTFLDPASNLLKWSEELTEDVWHRDPMLQLNGLENGVHRVVNAAQTVQGLEQTISTPGWYQYVFSAYVRASTPTTLRVRLTSGGGGQVFSESIARADWCRTFCSGSIQGSSEELTCRLEIPSGSVVEVRSLQLDAQPMPGEYRRTTTRNGVYDSTRFAEDRIVFTASGPDNHSTRIRLISRAGA
jgi:hypothetical protein